MTEESGAPEYTELKNVDAMQNHSRPMNSHMIDSHAQSLFGQLSSDEPERLESTDLDQRENVNTI